uniref:Uncharacterized protein n=1 Tax=Cucumis sativus TaxID=3659 RepID=A0A0A0LHN0_CUCSA
MSHMSKIQHIHLSTHLQKLVYIPPVTTGNNRQIIITAICRRYIPKNILISQEVRPISHTLHPIIVFLGIPTGVFNPGFGFLNLLLHKQILVPHILDLSRNIFPSPLPWIRQRILNMVHRVHIICNWPKLFLTGFHLS